MVDTYCTGAGSVQCSTLNEEEIFEVQDKRGLFQVGWIHVSAGVCTRPAVSACNPLFAPSGRSALSVGAQKVQVVPFVSND